MNATQGAARPLCPLSFLRSYLQRTHAAYDCVLCFVVLQKLTRPSAPKREKVNEKKEKKEKAAQQRFQQQQQQSPSSEFRVSFFILKQTNKHTNKTNKQ